MQDATKKLTKQAFDELLIAVIDEALFSLGESAKTAIYFHLEQKFNIKRQEIPHKIEHFNQALDTIFGSGSKPLELIFTKRLHEKIKAYGAIKPEDFSFLKYVNEVKRQVVTDSEADPSGQPNIQTNLKNQFREDNNFIALLNMIADPVVIVDNKGNFLLMNNSFETATGASSKEWLGKPFLDLPNFPEDSKAIAVKNLKRRYGNYQVEPYELEIFNPDGSLHQFEINGKRIEFSGQTADLVICHDVTQRNKLKQQLSDYAENLESLVEEKAGEIKEKEAKMRSVFNSSPDALMVIDCNQTVIDCNQAAALMFGYSSKEDIIGKNGLNFASARDRQKILEVAQKLKKDYPFSETIEYDYVTKDSREFPGELSLSVINDGQTCCFFAVTKDISERKEAQEKLVTSEKKYRKLSQQLELAHERILHERDRAQNYLDVADVLLLALDLDGTITLLNRKGCTILGCKTEDVLGKNWFDLFVPEAERMQRLRDYTLRLKGKTSRPDHRDDVVLCVNGERRMISWRHTLVRDSNGEVVGTLSSGEDVTEQKQIQQALIDSEEKFRGIVENFSDVIMLTRPDASISYISPAIYKLVGYAPEEFYGKVPPIFHPDDVKRILATHAKSLQGESGSDYHYRVITKDGVTKWVSHTWSPIMESGKVKLIVSTVRDITERKHLLDELQASEERFRAISTSAKDAIILVEKDECKIVYWNPASEKIFGYSEKDALGKKLLGILIPQHGSDNDASLKKIFAALFSHTSLELNVYNRDGSELLIELSLSSVRLEDKKCLLAVARDISERKRMEDALKQERDMLESITQNIGAGLAIIDRNYRIVWQNKYLKDIRPHSAVENRLCYATYNRLDSICPDCGVKKVFEGSPSDAHEYSFTRANGTEVWTQLVVTPIRDKDGVVRKALELAVDITEKKEMQKKLAEYSLRLEQLVEARTQQLKKTQSRLVKSERLAAIGELAGMVGHDLRNPLTSIKGAAYFLKTRYTKELDTIGKEMLATIDNSIDYSNKIVNDLLDYSRNLKLDLSEITPKKLLENTLSFAQVPDGINIIDETLDTFTVKVDAAKMSRVFLNLMKNAFDAMPKGGTLTVTSHKRKEMWEITFKDTGAGMEKETLRKLWTPLFTTKARGMGFGLPICKRIVNTHGGRIRVESTFEQGTKFIITIPVDPKIEDFENWLVTPSSPSEAADSIYPETP
ncbi:MAG: PAS domain S-box protein [Candidatus Bathyarchaeota archaeon]|nr:PAS domain S-box protein [Candidatus Bathyarchaeota archaeon]